MIRSRLPLLLARINLKRAERGESPLSRYQFALACGLSPNTVAALDGGTSTRVDLRTLESILAFASNYFPVEMNDILEWHPNPNKEEIV